MAAIFNSLDNLLRLFLVNKQTRFRLLIFRGLSWFSQNQIHSNQMRRAEQETRCLQESVQTLTTQNKDLHVQLQEIKRRQAEIECKVRSRCGVTLTASVDQSERPKRPLLHGATTRFSLS